MNYSNKIWLKNNDIKSFYLKIGDIYHLNKFIDSMLKTINLGGSYSMLAICEFKIKNVEGIQYRMLGAQIGFRFIKDDEYDYQVTFHLIHKKILYRLESFLEEYDVEKILGVYIKVAKINLVDEFLIKNVNKIKFPKNYLNVKDIKSKYNSKFLPLTVNTNFYGKWVRKGSDDYKNYLNLINSQLTILGKDIYNIDSLYRDMYIFREKYIILIKKNFNYRTISVYDCKLGFFEAKFTDIVIDESSFVREYNNVSLIINKGKIQSINIKKNLNMINNRNYLSNKSVKGVDSLFSNSRIGVLDLEVFEENSLAKVYAIGFCVLDKDPVIYYMDREKINTFDGDLILNCINSMLVSKYNGYVFYVHNLSYDGLFILYKLKAFNLQKGYEYYNLNPLYRNKDFIKLEISIKYNNTKIKITLIDSYSLLKFKLRDLCYFLGIEEDKGYFPYRFISSKTLNYVGSRPDIYYWEDIPNEEYNLLSKTDWDLKKECIRYLKKDLSSLLSIMNLFNKYIKRKFDIELRNSLTINSLSLNIFLKDFLKNSKIPIIKGDIYRDIKLAYYGGVTEVYKPHGFNLFYCDVNSLYPLCIFISNVWG